MISDSLWSPRALCLLFLSCLLTIQTVHALHFYLDSNEIRCFIEELPTDTVVEGAFNVFRLGMMSKRKCWCSCQSIYG